MQSIKVLLGLLASVSAIPFQQQPLGVVSDPSEGVPDATEPQTARSPRPLHGRFLHITGKQESDPAVVLYANLISPRFPSRPALQGRNVDRP